MKRIGLGAALILAAVVAAVPLAAGTTPNARDSARAPVGGAHGSRVVGYFLEWGIYGRGYRVKDVATSGSAAKLTAINYAFGNVAPDGAGGIACKLGDEWADYQVPWTAEQSVTGTEITWPRRILGNFQQLQALKERYPNVKVLISLGGWTWSRYFSDAALTPASRERFVASCIDLFIKGNLPDPGWGGMGGPGAAAGVFDGIDLDWEWPGSDGNAGNVIRARGQVQLHPPAGRVPPAARRVRRHGRQELPADGVPACGAGEDRRRLRGQPDLRLAGLRDGAGLRPARRLGGVDEPPVEPQVDRSRIRRSRGSRSTTRSRRTSGAARRAASSSSACRSTRAGGPASLRRTMVCTNRRPDRLPERGRREPTTTRS